MKGFILFIIAFVIYFLPSLISNRKDNGNSVFVVNLFLGWTLIGWVVALAWALNSKKVEKKISIKKYECPRCGAQSEIQEGLKLFHCPQCHHEVNLIEEAPTEVEERVWSS